MKQIRKYILFLFISTIFSFQISPAQSFSIETQIPLNGLGPFRNLYKINLENGERSLFYSIKNLYSIDEQKVSPNQKYVGLIAKKGFQKNEKDIDFQPTIFIILDNNGKEIFKFEDIQAFDFSPSDSEVVIIDGIKYEGLGFKPKNMKIINLISGITKISADVSGEYEQSVRWYSTNLQIIATNNSDVNMYDPVTLKKTKTLYKGIYFSPDRKYYYSPAMEGVNLKIYVAQSNVEIKLKDLNKNYNAFSIWLESEPHLLVAGGYLKEKYVIDVEQGIIKDKIEGEWVRFNKQNRKIITKKGDEIIQKIISK